MNPLFAAAILIVASPFLLATILFRGAQRLYEKIRYRKMGGFVPIPRRTEFRCPRCGGACSRDEYPPGDMPKDHSMWICDHNCDTVAYEVHDYLGGPVRKALLNVMTISN